MPIKYSIFPQNKFIPVITLRGGGTHMWCLKYQTLFPLELKKAVFSSGTQFIFSEVLWKFLDRSQIPMCINSHYHNMGTAVRLLLEINYSVEYIRRTKPKQAKLCVLPSCKLSILRYKINCIFHFTWIFFLVLFASYLVHLFSFFFFKDRRHSNYYFF